MTLIHEAGFERHLGSVGFPFPSVEVTMRDPDTPDLRAVVPGRIGEVWLRGPFMMAGYDQRPDENARAITADGWFRTGDLGRMEPDGALYLLGRIKDMINVDGANVYPAAIEDVVGAHPGIADVCAVGMPDEEDGERVRLFIVRRDPDAPDLRAVAPGEIGEVWLRGPFMMAGYDQRPDENARAITADGWFRTGDLATVDDEGYFTIVDRKKDMILRGGMNVYPREVEEVLYTHPDVLEAAVVAVPDDLLGEDIGAAVALRPGSTATLDDVQAFVKEKIAAYKYPRHLWQVDELPKGPTGKILRREVHKPADA